MMTPVLAFAAAAVAQQSVSPPEAASLRPIELSELVADLLPAEGSQQLGWTAGAETPVVWLTPDPTPTGEHVGLARVTVGGRASTFEGRELAWSVVVRPDLIKIEPGFPSVYCFGAAFTGCGFTAEEALGGSSLNLRQVCTDDFGGFSRVTVYELSAPGRHGFVRHTLSGDAEGSNAWLEISLTSLACEI
ncbi:hypothetical protein [Brevundimonas sp.]|uniref:hypothetical protein n=1 Tax=Brevundimonas sp. TaxID=1871086 RepID=UPI0025DD7E64|nr:hypothetical protein [Brevundimonas sp.]